MRAARELFAESKLAEAAELEAKLAAAARKQAKAELAEEAAALRRVGRGGEDSWAVLYACVNCGCCVAFLRVYLRSCSCCYLLPAHTAT